MAKNDYQALAESSNPFIENSSQAHHQTIGIDETTTDTENEDGNRENGIMIHVVPDTSKGTHAISMYLCLLSNSYCVCNSFFTARWNHIEDLDSFFTRMYYYHQKHGFNVMMVNYILDLAIFAFVLWFLSVVAFCIDYKVLDG